MSEFSTLNGYKVKDKKATRFYDNVELMKADTTLKEGMHVITKGYYDINDGGGAEYHITNTLSVSDYQEELNNNLFATLIIDNYAKAKQYGFKNDGSDNSLLAIELFKNKKVYFDEGTYIFDTITIDHDIEISGNNTILKPNRVSETNNKFKTMFNFTGSNNVIIKNITFQGYLDVEEQSGTLQPHNSLMNVTGLKSFTLQNCELYNFDNRQSSEVESLIVNRRAVLCTIHDTLQVNIDNNKIHDIYGEECFYSIVDELDRDKINMNFTNNKVYDIHTTTFNFIGNILNIKNNYYNFEYAGSCINCFALYLFVENEEIYGSYDSVYDNCEEVYFQGIDAHFKNIINYAEITNNLFSLSCNYTEIDNFINNEETDVLNCFRFYFNTNQSDIHKDCSTTTLAKCYAKVTNSKLVATHITSSLNNYDCDYNLTIENCELKCTVDTSISPPPGYLILSTPSNLILINNIIHSCLTGGSGHYTVLYNKDANLFNIVRALNNKIIHTSGLVERFIVGATLPKRILFIGNESDVDSSVIASTLTNVKAYGNYNYVES